MTKLELGVIVSLADSVEESFEKVREAGLSTCQLSCEAEKMVDKIDPGKVRHAAEKTGVRITSFFLTFAGQKYDLKEGPSTMGFVPEKYREKRLQLAKKFSDLVKEIGVESITSHVGFIPDDREHPLYKGFLGVMKEYIAYCGKNGQTFCFETGQELASTLRRTILDLGMENVGVNLDPANLVMYGMSNPLDAVEILGEWVKGLHAKDGLWPNRGEVLGEETPLGEGQVNFALLIPRLKERGFKGPITIEREITGPKQREDILRAIRILEPLL